MKNKKLRSLAYGALMTFSSLSIALGIVNPGFESGNLTGWTTSGAGPVAVVTTYSGYTAKSGNYFATVTGGCSSTVLQQTFTALVGESLSGWSFFKANDYAPYNDSGTVTLSMVGASSSTVLFQSSVAAVGNYGTTGWIPWTFTAPASGNYTIKITSTNALDCGLSSVVGIDTGNIIIDSDGDSILDTSDNCVDTPNNDQADNDFDGVGDVCDDDDDNDGNLDAADNCPFTSNSNQSDIDGDGQGDVCDGDDDGDSVLDGADNCPIDPNADQLDTDNDGAGDDCDADDDNDGVEDDADNCRINANADQSDTPDADGIGDVCDSDDDNDSVADTTDNCPVQVNPGQEDTDLDGDGNACDTDDDDDGVLDGDDNCQFTSNDNQSDIDSDGQGDVCDGDLDGDNVENEVDNCPNVANENQDNWDDDAYGDACDNDVDGDLVLNSTDICAFTELGGIVDPSNGCTIAQLCPGEGPRGTINSWRNHGKYVSCTAKTAESFLEQGLISEGEKDAIVSEAAQSEYGVKSK